MKVIKWLDEHFEESILVVFLVFITCISMVQICARIFAKSLPWPEEFCRLCWIWTVFLSLPFTIRKGSMLRVNVLVDMLPTKVRNVLNIVIDLLIAFALFIFFQEAISVVGDMFQNGRTTAALGWSMGLMYTVTLLGYGLGTLRSLQQAVLHIMHFNQKEMTTLEAAMQEAAEEAAAVQGGVEGGDAE